MRCIDATLTLSRVKCATVLEMLSAIDVSCVETSESSCRDITKLTFSFTTIRNDKLIVCAKLVESLFEAQKKKS